MSPRRAARPRHIVAMGGGGFSMERNHALDRYVLGLTKRRCPRVAFVGTASGDSEEYAARFTRAFERLGCKTAILPFFRRTPDLVEFAHAQDVLYVGGGNTRSMVAVWEEWGFHRVLRAAWRAGVVLAGVSAGANCWFQACNTDSSAGAYLPVDCLGLLPGAFCPHYDGEPGRRPSVHGMVRSGALPSTLALEDSVAAHYVGTRLHRVVASRAGARGYRVERRGSRVVETALPVDVLPRG